MATPYIGEIRMFAGTFAPVNWAFCDGSLQSIAENDTLFSLIGTTYGGDGVNTFALPNLISRIPFGTAAGYVLGQQAGAGQVTLLSSQLPSHTHAVSASNNAATSTSPTGNVWASSSESQYTTGAPNAAMDPSSVTVAGQGLPHDNMPPYLGLNFIIALFGIYPTPS